VYKMNYELSQEEKSLLSQCFDDLDNSKKYLFEFGQKYLKPLKKSREIQEKSYAILEFFLINKENYLENLMLPQQYVSGQEDSIRGINYTFRDFLGWSIFYPDEANRYFLIKDKKISILDNPEQRLVDKDKYRMGKKKEEGVLIDVRMKKDSDTKIDNGFTLMQKDNFLNATIACFVDQYFLDEKIAQKDVIKVEEDKAEKPKKKATKKIKG